MHTDRPIVGISSCRKEIAPHYYHAVGEKYITAVADGAQALPVLVPALGAALDAGELLARVDGLMFTGSPSNVEPRHYRGPNGAPGIAPPYDPHRDATTLPLLRAAARAGVPLLAICRGCQEMNVAFGGTLHEQVHAVQGLRDHREPDAESLDVRYGPAHEVRLTPGGLLERIAGTGTVRVNSLHGQGVETVGARLLVEAIAEDGLVEAFRVDGAPAFALGVQWHPEYKVMENAFSRALFEAFGEACRERAAGRRNP